MGRREESQGEDEKDQDREIDSLCKEEYYWMLRIMFIVRIILYFRIRFSRAAGGLQRQDSRTVCLCART